MFAVVDGSPILFCRADVVGRSQSVASDEFRSLKGFDFLAKVSKRGGGGNGIGGRSLSDGSGTWIGGKVTAGVITGASGLGDRGNQ